MKQISSLVVAALAVASAFAMPRRAADITVSGYSGSTTLENFPVLVRIAEYDAQSGKGIWDFHYADCAAGGADISFVSADGETVLAHEIDTWNTAGESLVWVRLPSLSGTATSFTFRWGDANPPSVTASDVWSANYIGVWHFSEDGGNAADATGHGLVGVETGSSSLAPASKVGGARAVASGTLQVADYESTYGGATVFSASGWFYCPGVTAGYRSIMNKKTTAGAGWSAASGWYLEMNNSLTQIGLICSSSTKYTCNIPNITQGWNYFHIVSSGSNVKLYLNGSTSPGINQNHALKAAGVPLNLMPTVGYADEFRVRGIANSADWTKAEYASVADAAFLSYGAARPISDSFIQIDGSPSRYSSNNSPAYEITDYPSAGTYTFTAPQYVEVSAGVRAYCTGWRLAAVAAGVETPVRTSASPESGENALTCIIDYAGTGGMKLVWNWEIRYCITATAGAGGSVSSAEQWVAAGTTATLTATPDSGRTFYHWTGDLPSGVSATASTISFAADQPRSFAASFGGVYYVADIAAAEDAEGYGLTPQAPFLTIGYAVAHVPEGSAIHVASGAYKPSATISLTTGIQVLGAGHETTSLIGSAIGTSSRMVHVNHPDAVFSGFTISNFSFTVNSTSDSRYGAAAYVQQGVIRDVRITKCTHKGYSCWGLLGNRGGLVENCEVDHCTGQGGFHQNLGNAFHQGSGTTRNCHFHHNAGITPGGMVYLGGGTMEGCRIEGNYQNDTQSNGRQGAGVHIAGGLLTNSVVRCNTNNAASAGIYMSGGRAANCTIVGNLSLREENELHSVSGLYLNNGNARAVNCILWHNGSKYSPYAQYRVASGTMTGCLANADPLFADEANGDFHLTIGSPAAGLGAHPYAGQTSVFRCGFSASPYHVAPGGSVTLSAAAEGAGSSPITYAWYLDGAAEPCGTGATLTLDNQIPGRHSVRLVATAGGATAESSRIEAYDVHSRVAYVSQSGSNTYPYDTPEKATDQPSDALCALWQEDGESDLYIAAGTYGFKSGLILKGAVRVHGAGRDVTILDGNYGSPVKCRGFFIANAGALVEDLTVTRTYYFHYSASGSGSGAKMSNGTIRNCRFVKCETQDYYQYAAAVYMSGGSLVNCELTDAHLRKVYSANSICLYVGGGLVSNCWIHANNRSEASNGGTGAYIAGGTMDSCLIEGNGKNNFTCPGSGLRQTGGKVRNCVIAANTNKTAAAGVRISGGVFEFNTVAGNVSTSDADGRSGLHASGSAIVRNSIIYGNGPVGSANGSILREGGTFTTNVVDKAVADGIACNVSDPLFADAAARDYHLRIGSPAIDNADVASAPAYDHDGAARPLGAGPDIGAYEYVPGSSGFICGIVIAQADWPVGSAPTATCTVEGAPGEVSYAWYADGGETPVSTSADFAWNGATAGYHDLMLVVTSEGQAATNEVAGAFNIRPLEAYAGPAGTNEYPYDTPEKAAPSLNDAYNAVWSGDSTTPTVVHVLEGTVTLNATIPIVRPTSIIGAGADKSVINGLNGGAQGFLINHDLALMQGVCVSNVFYNFQDSSANGAGASIRKGTMRDCRVTHCHTGGAYQSGAGIHVTGGLVTGTEIAACYHNWSYSSYGTGVYQTGGIVTNCWIHGNIDLCQNGGAGATVSGGLLTHCLIEGNGTTRGDINSHPEYDGSGVCVKGGTVRNCVIRGNLNRAHNAGVRMESGRLEHCTVYGNDAIATSSANSGLVQSGGTIVNSIFYANGPIYTSLGSVSLTGGTFATNLIDLANARAIDCYVADPLFADAENGDFHLRLGSPAIDKGAVLATPDYDYDGVARDAAPDLGAFEYFSAGGALACGIAISQTDYALGDTPRATATVEGSDTNIVSYAWYIGEELSGVSAEFSWANAPAGLFDLRLVVENGGGETAEATVVGAFNVHPFATFAATDGASVYPYDTPAKAATNVIDAFNAIWNGETEQPLSLTIAEGAYDMRDTIPLSRPITITGAGIDRTVLTGTNLNKRAFLVSHPDAVVSDLTLLGVRSGITPGGAVRLVSGTMRRIRIADGQATVYSHEGMGISLAGGRLEDSVIEGNRQPSMSGYNCCGAGIRMTGGLVSRCLIRGNGAGSTHDAYRGGSGIYMTGGTVDCTRVTGNIAGHGNGGVTISGGLLRNCLIDGNSGTGNGAALLVSDTSTKVYNCTVVTNLGGQAASASAGTIANTIVWGNAAGDFSATDLARVVNSDWGENTSPRNGNLSIDPLFKRPLSGDWSLQPVSPCRDAGDWTFLGATRPEVKSMADLAGNARLFGGQVEMGCYETGIPGTMIILR